MSNAVCLILASGSFDTLALLAIAILTVAMATATAISDLFKRSDALELVQAPCSERELEHWRMYEQTMSEQLAQEPLCLSDCPIIWKPLKRADQQEQV